MNSVLQRPAFVPFEKVLAIRVYRRNLPHWRQVGATYFVTFHLHDSIPANALKRLEVQRITWLSARGIDPLLDPRVAYEKLSKMDRFLYQKYLNRLREEVHDAGFGECVLKHQAIVDQLVERFMMDDGNELHIGDFIVMPNHVHMLIVPNSRELELCLKRIKGSSATLCNRVLNRQGTLWQADSFDHIVRNLGQLEKYRKYISDNASKAGIQLVPQAYYRADWL